MWQCHMPSIKSEDELRDIRYFMQLQMQETWKTVMALTKNYETSSTASKEYTKQ